MFESLRPCGHHHNRDPHNRHQQCDIPTFDAGLSNILGGSSKVLAGSTVLANGASTGTRAALTRSRQPRSRQQRVIERFVECDIDSLAKQRRAKNSTRPNTPPSSKNLGVLQNYLLRWKTNNSRPIPSKIRLEGSGTAATAALGPPGRGPTS